MKYAFIFGTSAFIVPQATIVTSNEDITKQILHVHSLYHDNEADSFFSINLDIKDKAGNYVRLTGNKAESEGDYKVETTKNSVKVLNADGSILIYAHQLDDETAMRLETNIIKEFEVNMPLAVIRISGEFWADGIHVYIENEKLWVNEDSWATSALAGTGPLRFTAEGVAI